jgi:hypothetical protein
MFCLCLYRQIALLLDILYIYTKSLKQNISFNLSFHLRMYVSQRQSLNMIYHNLFSLFLQKTPLPAIFISICSKCLPFLLNYNIESENTVATGSHLDRALPRFRFQVCHTLNVKFHNQWIRSGPTIWLPNSPDLIPLNLLLWDMWKTLCILWRKFMIWEIYNRASEL